MQQLQNISLSNLRFGHEFPGASINARQAGRTDGIEQLAASITEEGILASLHAFQDADAEKAGVYFVDDGNRRLAALQLLVKKKLVTKEALIPVLVWTGGTSKDALRKSAAAAAHAVPVHPVDQFEAFVACLDQGDTPEKIAERYALPKRLVQQRLALGQLSPVIRKAWREGKINAEAAGAYAATAHHAAQEKLWKRGGWEAKQPSQIRQHLIGDAQGLARLLKFVGEAEYKAAGGKLVEDLFGEKEGAKFADMGLLERLADEKLKKLCAEYVEKGWGWASVDSDLPQGAAYQWPRKSGPTAEEKKKLGVIIGLTYAGAIEAKTGVIKPGVKGIKASDGRSAPKEKKKPKGALSDSLAQRLSEALSFGASIALTHDKPELALALALAALTSADGPVGLNELGLATLRDDRHARKGGVCDFTKQVAIYLKLPLKDKLTVLAAIVGRSLDFQTLSAARLPLADKGVLAVVAPMAGARLNAEIRGKFDAEDYFKGVSSDRRLEAVREMNPQHEPLVAKMKKAEQVKACLGCFKLSKDWLPPELRTVHYQGPAAKKPAKKARA